MESVAQPLNYMDTSSFERQSQTALFFKGNTNTLKQFAKILIVINKL